MQHLQSHSEQHTIYQSRLRSTPAQAVLQTNLLLQVYLELSTLLAMQHYHAKFMARCTFQHAGIAPHSILLSLNSCIFVGSMQPRHTDTTGQGFQACPNV